jgi:hypothetical protein
MSSEELDDNDDAVQLVNELFEKIWLPLLTVVSPETTLELSRLKE